MRLRGISALAMVLTACGPTLSVDTFAFVDAPREGRKGQPIAVTAVFTTGDCDEVTWLAADVHEPTKVVTLSGRVQKPAGLAPCSTGISAKERSTTFVPQGVGTYRVHVKLWPSGGAYNYERFEPKVDPMPGSMAVTTSLAVEVKE